MIRNDYAFNIRKQKCIYTNILKRSLLGLKFAVLKSVSEEAVPIIQGGENNFSEVQPDEV